ncbi:flagellar motor switch phosphatase FliY [Alicyclobacillus hesperidum]|uniref:flagellar motor switch phosphatase FliY n=1 Tax=Alicyclobacillus hesperidum TaxID=89784 RepID=UPI00094494C2|nr:flagellar motor switch phosphatase FliY [Alicyclobacillus hesperidum]
MVNDQMKLSQDEIDALLNANRIATDTVGSEQGDRLELTSEEADILGEIGNISFGSAATSLSTLLQHRVDITTPRVSLIRHDDVEARFPTPYVLVQVDFTEGLRGSNALAIEIDDAKRIADLMLGGDGTNTSGELNELHLSAVGEAMNQMMGGAATSMSQMFGRYINISPPTVRVVDLTSSEAQQAFGEGGDLVNVEFQLRVDDLIDSHIMQLMPIEFAHEIVRTMGLGGEETASSASTPADDVSVSTSSAVAVEEIKGIIESAPAQSGQESTASRMSEFAPPSMSEVAAAREPLPRVDVRRPHFVDFGAVADERNTSPRNLSLLYDVPLNVTVELGRAKKMIREILELAPGSILELDKLAGEPVDIYVNNKKIAIGEVVVIDENFGVRVTDIVQAEQRITQA